jgi:hypothetical protein
VRIPQNKLAETSGGIKWVNDKLVLNCGLKCGIASHFDHLIWTKNSCWWQGNGCSLVKLNKSNYKSN